MQTFLAKVTSKGQVTIPVEVRRRMAIEQGATIAFDLGEDGQLTVRSPGQALAAVLGTLPPLAIPVDEAIRIARREMQQEAAQRYQRSMTE